ncbi:fungal-specific transcription factor domain-containing protein [Lipomyces doorenjongii]
MPIGTATRMGSKRSSIACGHCHNAKIRCDVSITGPPCTRCRERNLTDCQLIQSRRGLYDRKEWLRKMRSSRRTSQSDSSTTVFSEASGQLERGSETQEKYQNESAEHNDFPSSASSQSSEERITSNAPYSFVATLGRAKTGSPDKRSNEKWSVVFKYYADITNDLVDRNSISYFGECFPMSVLLKRLGDDRGIGRQSLESISTTSLRSPENHPDHMTPEKIAYLESQKCFTKPPPDVLEQYLKLFFQSVHPLYATIDRIAFMKMYKEDKVPWLLLHSICFAAATYSPPSVLCRENASTRREARMKYYFRAKTLFDFSYEKTKLTLLQSAVLLSFWGGQPHDYWNTFSWINIAVNIAETLGIHRSKSSTDISDEDRGLWKRIWSCLVTRDSFCAALLGKPLRINLLQCDAEFLTPGDFSSDADPGDEMWGHQDPECGMYVVAMTKLALILREMVQARTTHRVDTEFLIKIHKDLDNWLSVLPDELRLTLCDPDSPQYIYATAISLVYNHHQIYVHQMSLPESNIATSIALEAVSQITDIGSTLVTKSLIAYLPQNAYASFFMAIVMLFTQMSNCAGQPETLKLLQSQLKICEMVVYQAQDHWDHADWILALSDSLRQKLHLNSTSNCYSKSSNGFTLPSAMSPITNTTSTSLLPCTNTNVFFPAILGNDSDIDDFIRSLHMSGLNSRAEPDQRIVGEANEMFADMHNNSMNNNTCGEFIASVDEMLLECE